MSNEIFNSLGAMLVGLATFVTAVGGLIAVSRKTSAKSYDALEEKMNEDRKEFNKYREEVAEEFDKLHKKHRDDTAEREDRHRRELDERDAHHDNQMRDIRTRQRKYEGALISAVDHIVKLEIPYIERGEIPPVRPMDLQAFIAGI